MTAMQLDILSVETDRLILGGPREQDFEGQGLAFEAALAARTHAALYQNLDGVISYIAPGNTRSIALANRLGARFEREGTLLDTPCHIYRHPKEAV
jgi:RimJ/RimL family protein N-acetyltransferase